MSIPGDAGRSDRMRRRVLYWCLYDWANSAFATVMLTAVLPVYFLDVAPKTVAWIGMHWPAESLWAYVVGLSAAVMAMLMPFLGAVADQTGRRYTYWLIFGAVGMVATIWTGGVPRDQWWVLLLLFFVGNIGFGGSLVFYNALLPHIVPASAYDRVSSQGFAWGYVGGGLALAGVLVWMAWAPEWYGIPVDRAIRQGFVATGLWWTGFGVLSFWGLRDLEPWTHPLRGIGPAFHAGWSRLINTFRTIRQYRAPFRFLIAYFIYNDAVETTIALAAVFGRVALDIPTTRLVLIILFVQFLAFPGALFWGWQTRRYSTRAVLEVLLFIWAGATASACFIRTEAAFWGLAAVIAWVLGGIQALSRSYYARLFPAEYSGEFFGFYAVTSKFAAILGPILVGWFTQWLGDIRMAVPVLAVFFLIGWGILRSVPPNGETG